MASENETLALSPGHLLNEERVLRISPSPTVDVPDTANQSKMKIFNKSVRVATWNVRSLFMAGKLANVEAEMARMKIDILGMSEVRWPGAGQRQTRNGRIYFSGGEDREHRYGVALLVTSSVARSVIGFVPFSDRVILLKLQTSYRKLNIIQVYAPTSDKSDEEIEDFYNKVEEALRHTKKGEITMVIGDFNAKVGRGAESDVVGMYGLGERNERGDRLVQFCTESNLFIANTFFKQHARRLYTWKSPADRLESIVRNQIDFILLGHAHKRFVKTVTTYPGADINSDHNPVVMDFKFRRFTAIKKSKAPKKINIESLRDPEVRHQIGVKLEEKMKQIKEEKPEGVHLETWDKVRAAVVGVQENDIGFAMSRKKQEWMTEEILSLMDERRVHKNVRPERYAELNRIIRRKCREAKEQWMSEQCTEIERLHEKFDSFNMHRKVKEMTEKGRKRHMTNLKDDSNQYIMGVTEKLKIMKDYVEELFGDERPDAPPRPDGSINETGPEITRSEVIHAIKSQKNRKAVGPDQVHAEIIKLLGEQEGEGLDLLVELFNFIYATGKLPDDWLKSTFVPLPKKPSSSRCDEYRFISLMSHVLKIFLRIIHTRIYRKCEILLDDSQFGFQNGVGTREALFSLNVLLQRCRDMNVDVYACFIDYKQAFDSVKHHKLIEILKTTGVDSGELRIISELYWRQKAEIRVEQATSEAMKIEKGVRQGCILSPLLFNLYSEVIFKEALSDFYSKGVRVNGIYLNNIRYADDTVVLADNVEDLQCMMSSIVQHSESYGLKLNVSKTKVIAFSKQKIVMNLLVNGERVEQVTSYRYLGALVNEQCDPKREIRARIEMARATFFQMRSFFIHSALSLELRMRMVRCYVFSVLLYGCESWTLDPGTEKKLEAFELYLYRRILRISWIHKVKNEDVLCRMGKPKELLQTIKERKTRYLGHVMRGARYELLRLIIEGKIYGKRSVGRRRNSWLRDLRRWFGCSSVDVFRAAVDKEELAVWIANLREESAS